MPDTATAAAAQEQEQERSNHARNKTGLVGSEHPVWSADPAVNALWAALSAPLHSLRPPPLPQIQADIVRHASTTLARTHFNLDQAAGYMASAHTLRDHLIARWNVTQQHHTAKQVKRVYYLSMEFLLGRSFTSHLINCDLLGDYGNALRQLGYELEHVQEEEVDAALGNGGLGRLAACFMDSLATLNYPAWGYGLRYQYGIFQQRILNLQQCEFPDYWLTFGCPWEVPRPDVCYQVRFYGEATRGGQWTGGESVQAVAYDVPIPGFRTPTTINIRLWGSKPQKAFDLHSFNAGDYHGSVEEQQRAEHITSVLYPADNTNAGKELRLKQQYFFVAATLQDIMRRFKKNDVPMQQLPDFAAIQLNDTHPTLGIVELMRLLVDVDQLKWDDAWDIVARTFSFTNHTVLPEAMEKWPVELMRRLLPRHMLLIYDINLFFLQAVERRFPGDRARLRRMSIIDEEGGVHGQQVRMAHLAIVGSHTVNGVAQLHSQLIRDTVFKDFVDFYGPDRFQNKTNGITPRRYHLQPAPHHDSNTNLPILSRWLHQANPRLSGLISGTLGSDGWLVRLDGLSGLLAQADNPLFIEQWMQVKQHNKQRLAALIEERCGVRVSPKALFDVQVKRIHEYKRQFMNILGVIYRYLQLKESCSQAGQEQARVVIFGGKAAPGYFVAKLIIRLICSVAQTINNDQSVGDALRVVFISDYNVSNAEKIIPASDLSQHISTAGTEASGTSNMKFVLNGGLILGTLDGANIEILEETRRVAGREDCMFIFGALAGQVEDIRYRQRYSGEGVKMPPQLAKVIDAVNAGRFGDPSVFRPLLDTLNTDYYLIAHDFGGYLAAQDAADAVFRDKIEWARRSIAGAASMGKFSSDRCIEEYARDIWRLQPCCLPPID